MSYENTKLYKERSKLWHDARIKKTRVLTRPKGTAKLKSRWTGPYIINQVTPHGIIELIGNGEQTFLVNDQRVKHYFGGMTKEIVKK
ncbi:reverse transcriptase [Gossypium australe]|uniref:Reverse transcriptase n=1 Tax=Gossypium australe TaxID=47621 RepID=A0A5B6WZ34_9ROSI|nr:reverse transcriptase [Gossypium australe]